MEVAVGPLRSTHRRQIHPPLGRIIGIPPASGIIGVSPCPCLAIRSRDSLGGHGGRDGKVQGIEIELRTLIGIGNMAPIGIGDRFQ
jgi:hypothetical protein